MSEESKIESGFTWRALLGLLYGILVFQPALIWMNLSTGGSIAAGWVTFIIFAEIARLAGRSLTKSEAVVMLNLAGTSYFATFINFIYRAYFARSDVTAVFGLAEHIPSWWVSKNDQVWISRTFIDPSWLMPIGLTILFAVLVIAADLSMGLIARELYVVQERLPFPVQQVGAEGITMLVERVERRMDPFVLATDFAAVYALVLYMPSVVLRAFGYPVSKVMPIPWADFNSLIQNILPGASLGIATDLLTFAGGFIVSFPVVVSIFIGSFSIWVVGNHLLVRLGITQFAQDYFYGMPISQIMYRSHLHAWAGPLIGVALAAGIFPLIHRRRLFIQGIKSLAGRRSETTYEKPFLPLLSLLTIWLGTSICSVVIVYSLIPIGATFLIIMLIFSLGWSFLWTLVNSRAIGVTGVQITPPGTILPIVKYSYISTLPQTRYDLWFIDPVVSMGGSNWCATFKLLDLVGCTVKSYIKAYLFILPITILTGFLFVQAFWSMAPMPSILYPNTAIYWPLNVVNSNLWMTGRLFNAFDATWIIIAFALTGAIYSVTAVAHLPISVIGLATGVNTAIPFAITMLLGGVAGQIVKKKLGEGWWSRNRMTIAAGMSLGTAIVITVLSTIGMLAKAMWGEPY